MAAGDPVLLDTPAEWLGIWWLPGDENNTTPGRLKYDPEDGLHLELTSGTPPFGMNDEPQWILGFSVDGRAITLNNSFVSNWRLSIPGGVQAELRVNRAFFDMHAAAESQLVLHHLEARMTNLEEWLGVSGITVPRRLLGSGSIAYGTPAAIPLARSRGLDLAAHFDFSGGAFPATNPVTLTINQRAWVRAARTNRRGFRALFREISRFNGLLAFATSTDSALLELRGEATSLVPGRGGRTRGPVWVLVQRAATQAEALRSEVMTFRLGDARVVGMKPIRQWFRRAERFQPVYNVYLSALPSRQLHAEYRFLAFAQACEAFHARKHPGTRIVLIQRIEELVDELPAALRHHVPAHFPTLTRDTRNYFTHWSPRLQRRAASGAQLSYLTRSIKALFEMSLLMELGFNKTQTRRLVENNQRLVRGLQAFHEI